MKFLFNFDMFSGRYWHHLIHAELHGFPGFVFGILLLAALPLYVATTALIIRTKKPLITIPVPKPVKQVWSHMQPTLINPPTPDTQTETKTEKNSESTPDALPAELPSELRTAYIRARMNITPDQRSVFNQPIVHNAPENTNPTPEIPESDLEDIPLPTDFDIEPINDPEFEMPDFTQMSAPTFSDITFNDTTTNNTAPENPIIEHLNANGQKFEIIDDIIVTEKHAIASHIDTDFWVCDTESWFATGKQIPSPIAKVTKIAHERNLSPILYLGAENILDIETLTKTWETMGITIIKTPDALV